MKSVANATHHRQLSFQRAEPPHGESELGILSSSLIFHMAPHLAIRSRMFHLIRTVVQLMSILDTALPKRVKPQSASALRIPSMESRQCTTSPATLEIRRNYLTRFDWQGMRLARVETDLSLFGELRGILVLRRREVP